MQPALMQLECELLEPLVPVVPVVPVVPLLPVEDVIWVVPSTPPSPPGEDVKLVVPQWIRAAPATNAPSIETLWKPSIMGAPA